MEGWDLEVSGVAFDFLSGNGSTCVGLQSVISMCPPEVDVIIADVLDSNGEGENRTRFPRSPPDAEETKPESDRSAPLLPPTPDMKTSSDIESGGVGFVGVPPLLVPP